MNVSFQLPSIPQWGLFDARGHCESANITLDCNITFDPNGHGVDTFGGVKRGFLQPNLDVAGVGTVYAFFILSGIVLCISAGIVLANLFDQKQPGYRPKRRFQRLSPREQKRIEQRIRKDAELREVCYDFFESALRAISDVQILLALALALSFIFLDDCSLLEYHWDIGVRLLLLACANYLLTIAYSRRILRPILAGIAALLRFLAVFGIMFILGSILATQNTTGYYSGQRKYIAEPLPPSTRNDSVIFLKAVCFLDPDSQQSFGSLSDQQRQSIGLNENKGQAAEWIFWVMLVVAIGLVMIIRTLIACLHRSRPHAVDLPRVDLKGPMCPSPYEILYWVLPWFLAAAIFAYSAVTVAKFRQWAGGSGWLMPDPLGHNAEDNVGGFGQTASLAAIAAVAIAGLDAAAGSREKQMLQKMESE